MDLRAAHRQTGGTPTLFRYGALLFLVVTSVLMVRSLACAFESGTASHPGYPNTAVASTVTS